MKAFLSIALVLLLAGLSGGGIPHRPREKAKEIMKDLLHKFIDTAAICHKKGETLNCCVHDLLKNNFCLGLLVDVATFHINVSLSINGKTFITRKISEHQLNTAHGIVKAFQHVSDLYRKFSDSCRNIQNCCVNDLLKNHICISIKPDKPTLSVNVSFSVNDMPIIQRNLSSRYPPKVCMPIPYVNMATVCIQLYDVTFENHMFRFCRSLGANIIYEIAQLDLNCLQIMSDGHIDIVPASTKLESSALIKVDTSGLIPIVKKAIHPRSLFTAATTIVGKLFNFLKNIFSRFHSKT